MSIGKKDFGLKLFVAGVFYQAAVAVKYFGIGAKISQYAGGLGDVAVALIFVGGLVYYLGEK